MNTPVHPRPETCSTCGNPSVHPRVMQVQRGKVVITEAHWICPRCNNRFKVGTVSTDTREKPQN